jgi:hypothetical protein
MVVRRILARAAVVGGLAVGGLAVTAGVAHAQPNESCIRHNLSLMSYHLDWSAFWLGMAHQFYDQGDYGLALDATNRADVENGLADAFATAARNC